MRGQEVTHAFIDECNPIVFDEKEMKRLLKKYGIKNFDIEYTKPKKEMKKIKVVCKNNSIGCQDDFTICKSYKVKQCEDGFCKIKDNDGWKWVIGENDFNYNFEVVKETKVVFSDYPIQEVNIPKHYDNSKGTLYQVATERGWNSYLFDIVKRLERAEKKGEFKTDLEKSKVVIDLWLKESEKL